MYTSHSGHAENISSRHEKYNYQIQTLRGFFCLMIVIYHMTCRYSSIYGHEQFYIAYFKNFSFIALIGFFCISGYFADGKLSENGVKYFCHKLYRLYPAYFVSISVIYLTQLTGLLGPDRSTTFAQYLLNVPFLNVALRTRFVDGAHWYVAFLVLVYLFSALLRLLKIYQHKFFPIFNIIVILAFSLIIVNSPYFTKIHDYLNYYFFFSIGIGFRRYNKSDENRYLILLIVIAACYAFAFNNIYKSIIICITLFAVKISLDKKVILLEKTKGLQYLGERSYLIYLLHQNIGFMVTNFMINSGFNEMPICVTISSLSGISIGIMVYTVLKYYGLPC